MRPFGVVEPGMQPLAPFLSFGQMLEQQAAAMPAAILAAPRRQADQ